MKKADDLDSSDYFAARGQAGPILLAEMLEESAFWTAHQFRVCMVVAWAIFVIFLVFAIFLLFSILPFLQSEQILGGVRVICAVLVTIISTDFLGKAQDFTAGNNFVSNISTRLQTNKAAGYPLNDLIIILGDYNSAVEGSPMILPGVYRIMRDKLNRLWQELHSS